MRPSRLLAVLVLILALPAISSAARNVIILVGDGMGLHAMTLHRAVCRAAGGEPSNLERLMVTAPMGLLDTSSLGNNVTDSAAAATALFCGTKTLPDVLGIDGRGAVARSILEDAAASGRATGLVSTHRITDATPAALVAHLASRDGHAEVADAIVDHGVDVVLGGGARYFIPKDATVSSRFPSLKPRNDYVDRSGRRDGRDLLAEMAGKGYVVVSDRTGLAAASGARRLVGLFDAHDMSFEIDRRVVTPWQPTLGEMARASLDVLATAPDGFFLMVEGASIDSAAHTNDAGAVMGEMAAFDEAVGICLEAARRLGDTLVIVAADHETGIPVISYKRLRRAPATRDLAIGGTWEEGYDYIPVPSLRVLLDQRLSFRTLVDMAGGKGPRLQELMAENTPWTLDASVAERVVSAVPPAKGKSYGEIPVTSRGNEVVDDFRTDPTHLRGGMLAAALAPQTGICWATGNHGSGPVPVFAVGRGAGAVRGLHDNSWLAAFVRSKLTR